MRLNRANRWSLAFADLSLLMLGCMALLALQPTGQKLAAEAASKATKTERLKFASSSIFESGEAMLSVIGKSKITAIVDQWDQNTKVRISLSANAVATTRLDSWELSAARMASIGRTLRSAGVTEDQIMFGRLNLQQQETPQQIIIAITP